MNNFFTLLVIGDNPEELIKKYDSSNEVPVHIKYNFKEKDKLYNTKLKLYEEILKNKSYFNNEELIDNVKVVYDKLKRMTPFDYYQELTVGFTYDEKGNALTNENPDGKYETITDKLQFSTPLLVLNDDKDALLETNSSIKKDVQWQYVHQHPDSVQVYDDTWELCVNKSREPETDKEKNIYKNMIVSKNYFDRFPSKEDYINYNTSFWTHSVLNENGWQDIEDDNDYYNWIINYYDKFIKDIDENKLITLFEYNK